MKLCESGMSTGEWCEGAACTRVEWMPEHLRASHDAAGNRGMYPFNGAHHFDICAACAEELTDDWCTVVVVKAAPNAAV